MAVRGTRGYLFAAAGLCVAAGALAAPQPAQKKPAGRVQPPPPVRITPKRTATMPVPRHLALVGVTRIGNRSQAWLVNRNTGMRATVAPGQTVFGYQVKQIDGERVVFTQNGRQFSLRLGENPEPQSLVAGYQSEMRASSPTTSSASGSTPSEITAAPVAPESRAPAAGSTTVIEVNPVTEVRQVPGPASGGASGVNSFFDPNLAGSTFYPGLGTGYPGFLPLYPEEAIYPDTAYGPSPYSTPPYAPSPYATGTYPVGPYPVTPYAAPYPAAPTFDQGFYPGEGIIRGRFSGNFPGYGPFAPPYPSGQPRGMYSADWPQDLRFIPLQRGNPQTYRRRSGDYGGEGYSNNPQTRRRRQYYDR